MTEEKRIQGKKNRAAGKAFERKVRADLEEKGWTVSKWGNNVNLTLKKMEPAKSQFNPYFKRIIGEGSGFPDFITFRYGNSCDCGHECGHIEGVECKLGKYLDAEEKEKCAWLLENKIFSRLLIAYPGKKRGEIIYEDFKG